MTTLKINWETVDYSKKSVLARACDPELAQKFAKTAPSLLGNAEYVPVTNDAEFFELLKTKKWSVVYFAPGACRFSAAKLPIPGGNLQTAAWTIDEYKRFIIEEQGDAIKIAQSPFESESLKALRKALSQAQNVR